MKSVKVSDYMTRRLVTFHQGDNVVQAMGIAARQEDIRRPGGR